MKYIIVDYTNCGGTAACTELAQTPHASADDAHGHEHEHAADSPLMRYLGPFNELARSLAWTSFTLAENMKTDARNLAACDILKRAWTTEHTVKIRGECTSSIQAA